MKQILCLFIFIFCAFITHAQIQKTYDVDAFDFFTSVKSRSNEVFATVNAMPATNSNIVLISSTNGLTTNFMKMYSGTASDESYEVSSVSDGGYLISGATKSFGSPVYNAFVIRTNATGNIIWSKTYGSNGTDQFHSGIELADNNFMFTGKSDKISAGNDDLFLVKTDPNGDTIFTVYYKTPDGYSIGNNIIQHTNGDVIIAGMADTTGGANQGSLLMRFDTNGNLIWTRVYNNPGFETLNEVKEDADGNLLAAGSCVDNGESYATLLKVNPNGNLLWAKKFTSFKYAYGITIVNAGKIVLDGISHSFITTLDHSASICVDSTGNVLWAKRYGGVRQSSFAATAYNQGIIYHGGYLSVSPGDDAYLISSDTNGSTTVCYEEIILVNDSVKNYAETYTDPWVSVGSGLTVANVNPVVSNPSVTETNLQNMSLSFTTQDIFADGNCNGSTTVNPVNGSAPYNFSWSNFQSNQTISNLCAGSYIVDVQDELGCIVRDTAWITIISPENPICLVTVDSTSTKNYVVWDKPAYGFLDSFRVYRDIVGTYTLVGSVAYDSLSRFVDNTPGVNPNTTSYRYKITTVDTLGNESILSAFHKTLHLTTSIGGSGERNLIWDGYQGFGWGYYYRILRDTLNNGTYLVHDSVTNSNFTYTDWTAPVGIPVNYLIEIVYPGGCTATRAVNHNSTRSNRSQSGITGIGHSELIPFDFSIIPNPASGAVSFFSAAFSNSETGIEIYTSDGRMIFKQLFYDRIRIKTADVSEFGPGLYFVKAISAEGTRVNKLIITK